MKALFVIANHGFQDMEFDLPRQILSNAGFDVMIAAGQKGKCLGAMGLEVEAIHDLSEVNGADFDVVVFVGGGGAQKQYSHNSDYLRLACEAKIIGAICIAPMIVSDSQIFKGKRVTGWNDRENTQKKYIETNEGVFTGEDVTVDGNIVTANGPAAAKEFGEKILELVIGNQ